MLRKLLGLGAMPAGDVPVAALVPCFAYGSATAATKPFASGRKLS